jgi:hypothetical protein
VFFVTKNNIAIFSEKAKGFPQPSFSIFSEKERSISRPSFPIFYEKKKKRRTYPPIFSLTNSKN